MNHLESSFTGKNSPWRYVVMFVAVILASNVIGGAPVIVAMFVRAASDPDLISTISANPGDLGALGLGQNVGFMLMLFPFIAGLLAFALLVKPLNGRSLKSVINGTTYFRWNRFLLSALVFGLLSAIYFFIYLKADPGNFRINNISASLIPLVLISILFIPFQAAFEEVLFRGYLMQGFTVLTRNRWAPLLLTSLLFGLMHSFNPEVQKFGFITMMPQYVLFGLIFGIVAILDDGIEAAIGAHAANNIFLCVMVTNADSALQTSAVYEQVNVFPWIEFAGLLVTGVVFLLLLKRIFRWDSFSLVAQGVEPPGQETQSPYTDVWASVR